MKPTRFYHSNHPQRGKNSPRDRITLDWCRKSATATHSLESTTEASTVPQVAIQLVKRENKPSRFGEWRTEKH